MEELLDEEKINAFFRLLGYIAPLAGLLLGMLCGVLKPFKSLTGEISSIRFIIYGLLAGLAGPFLSFSWWLLNKLTWDYGPGAIKAYAIFLAFHIPVGVLYGTFMIYLFYRFFSSKKR
jgi:hypothetical protein